MNPRNLALLVALAALGCHAQVPAPGSTLPVVGQPLPPALARRVEVLLRQKAQLPPGSTIAVAPVTASELSGYDAVSVTFTKDGNVSRPINFMISADGKTLAQFSKFDITPDPRSLLSAAGRPARGGGLDAPVQIVGFDDLECPYCARLNDTIFPALTKRYGDSVRIVYKDMPIEQHPWAMRAAIDVNCLGAQSSTAYWDAVDTIHAHASSLGEGPAPANADKAPAEEKTLPRANQQLDKITREQAVAQKLDVAKVESCVAKQDSSAIDAEKQLATTFNVDSTPTLFINGAKIEGAVSLPFLFGIVDQALIAEGKTPPPPYAAPAAVPAATTHTN